MVTIVTIFLSRSGVGMVHDAVPWWRRFFARLDGQFTKLFFALTLAIEGIVWIVWPDHLIAVLAAFAVLAGGWAGAHVGRSHPKDIDVAFKNISGRDVDSVRDSYNKKRGIFLSTTVGFFAIYVIGYLFAHMKLAMTMGINWAFVVAITALTLGIQMYFCARYASFVGATSILKALADDRREVQNLKLNQLKELHSAVFRDEQIYEPPGNVFVTMGITATFLGLSVGLATLDLTAITHETDKNLASLYSFVGCMGLALGVSMLGVLMAMMSQWLRGHGPAERTEALLDRVAVLIGGAERPAGS